MTTSSEMLVPTMFYFNPETMEKPVAGIQGIMVYKENVGREVLAIALGRTKTVMFDDKTEGYAPYDDFHASKMIWASEDDAPKSRGRKLIQGTFRRGRSIFIDYSSPERKVRSLRINTGVWGGSEVRAALLAQLPLDPTDPKKLRRLIQPHGSYAMQNVEGVEHILGEDHELDAEARHVQGRSFGFYRVTPTERGELRVYSQRSDTYNTMPGAEILSLSCVDKGGPCVARVIHSETKGEDYRIEWYDRNTQDGAKWYRAFIDTAWKYAETSRARREANKGAATSAA